MKTCSKCRETKSLDQFHRKTKAKDGFNPSCKQCVSVQTSRYYLSNRETVIAKSQRWFEENRERVKQARQKHYSENKEVFKKKAKQWAEENRGRRREISAKYAEANRAKLKQKNLAYIERLKRDNPEVLREQYRRAQAIRRTRMATAGGFICQESWNAILNVFETGVCLYCGTYGHKLTMDHWVPVALGGKTEAGNLIPCCKSCNSKKQATHPDEWCSRAGVDRAGIEIILNITKEALAA